MEHKLQMIEEDMNKLSKMGDVLFASWQDQMSDHFSKGCLDEILRQWRQCSEAITPLLQQLKQLEAEIHECYQQSQRR